MFNRRLSLLAMACFGLLEPGLSAASSAQYTITGIAVPGARSTVAMALNERGQVTGYAEMLDGTPVTFVYSAGEYTLPDTLGASSIRARDINDAGDIVGAYNLPGDDIDRNRAFAWIDGVTTDLGDLGTDDAFATAIDRRSTVYGVSGSHAFSWRKGHMRDLGAWDENSDVTVVMHVNAVGVAVGYAVDYGVRTTAFKADRNGRTPLPTLGGEHAAANGINDHGTICGWAYTAGGKYHAFRYKNGEIADLGVLAGGPHSEAKAINNAGDIVGVSGSPRGDRAVIARAGSNQVVDLNTLVEPQGWKLQDARDINDRGEIVGGGNQGAFLLTPIPGAGARPAGD